MSAVFKQVIEHIKDLSANERAFVAHCLISSLESRQDDDVDNAWAELSEKRLVELKSGKAKGISWHTIKDSIKNQDG